MFWKDKRVFVTGHTGFKGSWLSLWLCELGARVKGFALEPPTTPSLFVVSEVAHGLQSVTGDINDFSQLQRELHEQRPEIVFHLAAQPLVRASYEDPLGTFQANVMGTANLLEAVRTCGSVRAVVVITTDKCYENREWAWPYRETDVLGGHDPYSSSKACAELVVSAFRKSYFSADTYDRHGVCLASARAGNVIGGGDWARDRLIPDIIRAFSDGQPVEIRNPASVRPWQHVLEPLRGYLMLAEQLYGGRTDLATAWNFGPNISDAKPVEWIVTAASKFWGQGASWTSAHTGDIHEAQVLKLDWSKAAQELRWTPALTLEEALKLTLSWYKCFDAGKSMRTISLAQLSSYASQAGYYSEPIEVGQEY